MSFSTALKYTHYGPDPNDHPDQKEINAIINKMKKPPLSYVAIGHDGVLRSLNLDNEVVDAVGLPPQLIKAFIDRFPYNEELEARFQNSDGTMVPQEQWWAPDPSILPQPYTAERKEEFRREYEENKDIIEEMKQKRENGENQGCGVVIRSNYKIGS